jgi:hypothetical protein
VSLHDEEPPENSGMDTVGAELLGSAEGVVGALGAGTGAGGHGALAPLSPSGDTLSQSAGQGGGTGVRGYRVQGEWVSLPGPGPCTLWPDVTDIDVVHYVCVCF